MRTRICTRIIVVSLMALAGCYDEGGVSATAPLAVTVETMSLARAVEHVAYQAIYAHSGEISRSESPSKLGIFYAREAVASVLRARQINRAIVDSSFSFAVAMRNVRVIDSAHQAFLWSARIASEWRDIITQCQAGNCPSRIRQIHNMDGTITYIDTTNPRWSAIAFQGVSTMSSLTESAGHWNTGRVRWTGMLQGINPSGLVPSREELAAMDAFACYRSLSFPAETTTHNWLYQGSEIFLPSLALMISRALSSP